jgi:hypothetical protein
MVTMVTWALAPYGYALIHAGLGDKENALIWLRKAVEERSHWLVWIRLDPRFEPLRGDRCCCAWPVSGTGLYGLPGLIARSVSICRGDIGIVRRLWQGIKLLRHWGNDP